MALARAHPAIFRDDDGHRLVRHRDFNVGDRGHFLNQRAPIIAKLLRIVSDFLDDELGHFLAVFKQGVQLAELNAQFAQLLLNLDPFEAGQLAQANFENVLGLYLGQTELGNQRRLGLV